VYGFSGYSEYRAHKASLVLETGVEFECVDRFCYLGDMTEAGGGAELASVVRLRCAWGKFWELSGFLIFHNKGYNHKMLNYGKH
jgi:hypothetical protein